MELLKRDKIVWNPTAETTFITLKNALRTAPVLALLDFSKSFVVEMDASAIGIGAILIQGGHPIAFISKTLSARHQSLSAYEKELLAILFVVKK